MPQARAIKVAATTDTMRVFLCVGGIVSATILASGEKVLLQRAGHQMRDIVSCAIVIVGT